MFDIMFFSQQKWNFYPKSRCEISCMHLYALYIVLSIYVITRLFIRYEEYLFWLFMSDAYYYPSKEITFLSMFLRMERREIYNIKYFRWYGETERIDSYENYAELEIFSYFITVLKQ